MNFVEDNGKRTPHPSRLRVTPWRVSSPLLKPIFSRGSIEGQFAKRLSEFALANLPDPLRDILVFGRSPRFRDDNVGEAISLPL
jgi:hypothetical protein